MMTKEECLELAKKCGFALIQTENLDGSVEVITIVGTPEKLLAYTSAIEEKYQTRISELEQHIKDDCKCTIEKYEAQIAMLRDELLLFKANFRRSDFNPNLFAMRCDNALSTPQATSDAFIAEVKARTLEELLSRHRKRNGTFTLETIVEIMLSELRDQQEGKEGK